MAIKLEIAANNGDVLGPLSSTDHAIARYDGVTGKVIQDSDLIIEDTGNLDHKTSGETITIGATNASTINIGRSGATINLIGDTTYQQVTNLDVSDKLITVNKGGGAGSASGTGIEFEENSLITGYIKSSSDRNSIQLKAPNTAGIITLTPGATDFEINNTIVKSSSSSVTDNSVVRMDSTTGKLVQTSGVTIDDSNNLSGVATATADLVNVTGNDIVLDSDAAETATIRKDGTQGAAAVFTLPDSTTTLASTNTSQTLTNKTIDGDDNTISDLALSSLKTVLADANKFIERDGTGAVISGKAVPTGDVVGTSDAQDLSNKKISNYLDFDEATAPSAPSADDLRLYVIDTNGETRLQYKDSTGLPITINEDIYYIVRNTSGATINKGQAVYVTGATGSTPNVSLAQANSKSTVPALGVAMESIDNNGFGRIMSKGTIENIDTSAFTTGDSVWISAATAGGLTNTRPSHPNLAQRIGVILNSGAGNGVLEVDNLAVEGDEYGTIENTFSIGDNTAGTKTIEFKNGSTLSLQATPTGSRTVTLPDSTGTLSTLAGTETLSNKTLASPSVTTSLNITNQGELRLNELTANGSFYIAHKAASDLTANRTLIWPDSDGSNGNVLSTDGAGNLSWISNSGSLSISTKTSAYTLTSSDDFILADATTAGFTLTLPAAADNSGKVFTIIKIDSSSNDITIDANGTETIDGNTTYVLYRQHETVQIVSNGTTWYSSIKKDDQIVAVYNTDAGQSIPHNTETVINFEDESKDTHGSVIVGASWRFEAKSPGDFAVDALVTLSSIASFNSGETFQVFIKKNNSSYPAGNIHTFSYTGAADAFTLSVHGIVSMNTGDYIDIRATQTSGSSVSLFASGIYNTVSIRKI